MVEQELSQLIQMRASKCRSRRKPERIVMQYMNHHPARIGRAQFSLAGRLMMRDAGGS